MYIDAKIEPQNIVKTVFLNIRRLSQAISEYSELTKNIITQKLNYQAEIVSSTKFEEKKSGDYYGESPTIYITLHLVCTVQVDTLEYIN